MNTLNDLMRRQDEQRKLLSVLTSSMEALTKAVTTLSEQQAQTQQQIAAIAIRLSDQPQPPTQP